MSDTKPDLAQKQVLQIYAAFGAALVLSIIPTAFAAILSIFLGTGVLVAAYYLRKKTEMGSLVENHMTFIIRTVWIGSLFLLLTMTIGSIYLFLNLDNVPLEPCMSQLLSSASAMTNMGDLQSIFGSCYEPYWVINSHTLITSGVIIAAPILVYFAVRYARGLSRAMNRYRVSHPRAWF